MIRHAQQHVLGLFVMGAVATVLSFLAPSATAKDSSPDSAAFTGTWLNTGDQEEEYERQRAIRKLVDDIRGVKRGIVKMRMDEFTTPPKEISVKVAEDRIEISSGGHTISLQFGAKPITVESNGNQGKVAARIKDGKIVVTVQGDQGERVAIYKLSEDKQELTRSLRVTGDQLPHALFCRATYRRKPDTEQQQAPKAPAQGEE